MTQTPFVHLHLHSMYSLLDGAIKISDLIKKAKDYNMPAVAITDHGNMFGAMEFFTKAKDKGIKPILGSEVYIAPRSRFDRKIEDVSEYAYHLVLLCQNTTGFRNLSKLVSAGFTEGFYRRPRIDKELLKSHSEGLICLSGCLQGEVAHLCEKNKIEEAVSTARWFQDVFGDRYYIEIQENTLPEQHRANQGLLEVSKLTGAKLVATNDCHYLNKEDAEAHEILLCLQTGKTLSDPSHMRFTANEFYVKSPEEMAAAFSYAPESISNTIEIADRCDVEFDFKTYHFPKYEVPATTTLDETLEDLARAGLAQRIEIIKKQYPEFSSEQEKLYGERLTTELACIKQMGFPGYFLIVQDFINWSKRQGIPVGPGRGSAAGSLVAYAIGITDLDPIPYNLLFERFLNPERISMPDIDVDFCQTRREEAIQYVAEKYGREKTAQIITFGTMSAKAVVKDVARVLDFTFDDANRISKLIPHQTQPPMTLTRALEMEPKLVEMMETDARVKRLIDTALKLEGLARHASTHAAGVVVTPSIMDDFCPIYKDNKTQSITTQFSMKYVEKIGLVKFDFLGLKNLTVIDNAVKQIRRTKSPDFDIRLLRYDDPEAFALLQAGNTTGVFQLESSGMRELLTKLKPSCFEDIIAVCALYRPGPLGSGMVDDFIERKHGRKAVVYDLPELEPILKDTYGVIVYQEQVMQIARTLAGYSLGGADLLRRAMGKKDMDQMAKERDKFLAGANTQGVDPNKAGAIFDLMAKFAEYGFNKSHSAAYALIAYQTAFLKAHYPVEFMAALLTEDMGNTDKTIKNVAECHDAGIDLLPPDINASHLQFTVDGSAIRYGLGAIKGVGEAAIDNILEVRNEKPFASYYNFCKRVDLRTSNKKVMEALIKAGAFDSTGATRPQLIAVMETTATKAQKIQKNQNSTQFSLFGDTDAGMGEDVEFGPLPQVPEWDKKEMLIFEKEVLGFYLSGHPLEHYLKDIKRLCKVSIEDFPAMSNKSKLRICGIVTSVKEITTRRGDRMGFALLEDLTGRAEMTVFSDVYAKCSDLLKTEEPIMVMGLLESDGETFKVMASEIVPLAQYIQENSAPITITIPAADAAPEKMASLKEIVEEHKGTTKIAIKAKLPDDSEMAVDLSGITVNHCDSFVNAIQELFPGADVEEATI